MRIRRGTCFILLVLLAGTTRSAWGGVCALDDAPGATLLLPYFEVELLRPAGRTTLLSIHNAGAASVLTNVTLWSDLGVPTFHFPIYLTGYDIQTINLRDVFAGTLPRTAAVGTDPSDTISPDGPFSSDLDFPSCASYLPAPLLPALLVTHLRNAHTGRPSLTLNNSCAGQNLGDDIARGYLTIDTVRRCDVLVPSDRGYFGAAGVATNQNVLWGDFALVDEANSFAQGENLIALEADPAAFRAGDSTFYGRYVGYAALDAREPLASVWASRFVTGGAFTGGTELLVWRDSGSINAPFPCNQNQPLPWYPLDVDDFAIFDEQETADRFIRPDLPVPLPPFPLLPSFSAEANRVRVDSSLLPVPFSFGWVVPDFGRGTIERRPAQAWVATLMNADGRFSVGLEATPLVDVCRAKNPQFGRPGI